MPLYQFWCDECLTPHEILMSLAKLEEYDRGGKDIPCPNCYQADTSTKALLKKLICPPKTITIN